MFINYKNKNEIDKINIHDYIFENMHYNYDARTINLVATDDINNIKYNINFDNVIMCIVQSCSFWNGGNSILGISILEESEVLDNLYGIQNSNINLYKHSYLAKDNIYIPFYMQINSGDDILIIAESMNIDDDI